MTKKILIISITLIFIPAIVHAMANLPAPGEITKYHSQNGIFSLEIKILEYTGPDISSCEVTFKKEDNANWIKEMPTTPGFVKISNNGDYFIFGNWGWRDEGGYKSISFYNGKGETLKTIEFGELRWIFKTYISKDGNYFIFSSYGKSRVTLYYVPTQTIIWDKDIWIGRTDDICISESGDFILLSSFDYKSQYIAYYYLNKDGNFLWEKEIEYDDAYDKDLIWLSDNGREFKYYNPHEKKWFLFKNTDGEIIFKNGTPD